MLTALWAALQIVYGHWSIYFNWHFLLGPWILHLVGVIYILLLIKIHSGRREEKKKNKKTRKQALETKPWRYGSGEGTQALYEMEMWQDITVCMFVYVCADNVHVCVRWWLHKIIQGLLKYLHVNASVRVIARNCLVLEVAGNWKRIFMKKKKKTDNKETYRYMYSSRFVFFRLPTNLSRL